MDWNQLESESNINGNFKDYAPNGVYTAKLDHVEVKDNPDWKSPALTFYWQETDEYKFPRSATHWLSMAKPAWRAVHNRNILMAFGFEKEKAQQLVEVAEKDQDRDKIIKAYTTLYTQVAKRGATVKITVHDQYDRDGKPVKSAKGTAYGETDFKSSSCRMANGPKQTAADQMGEAVILEDIPFFD